jgi:hypothetical protein
MTSQEEKAILWPNYRKEKQIIPHLIRKIEYVTELVLVSAIRKKDSDGVYRLLICKEFIANPTKEKESLNRLAKKVDASIRWGRIGSFKTQDGIELFPISQDQVQTTISPILDYSVHEKSIMIAEAAKKAFKNK